MNYTILFAILLTTAVVWVYFKLRIPRNLQHIPTRPLVDWVKDMFDSETSVFEKLENMYGEQLRKTKVMLTWKLGKWFAVVSSKDAAKMIYTDTKAFLKVVPADDGAERLVSKFLGEAVLFSNGDVWRKHRKVTNPPFKKQFQVNTFSRAARQFFHLLDNTKEQLDIHQYMQRITMDAMGKDIMGVEFNAILNQDVPFINAYNNVMKGAFAPLPTIFPKLDAPWNPLMKPYFEQLEFIDKYFAEILDIKKKEVAMNLIDDSNLDLLSLLIKAGQESKGEFSDLDIRNNVMTFLLAGHDTTAFALSSALHYLAENPDIQEKARKEIMEVVGYNPTKCNPDNAMEPTLEQTKEMHYLMAVMKETMRISPSVARLPLRVAAKDVVIDGYNIPKGTYIVLDIYNMQHDSEYFKDPESFNPDRFIHTDSSKDPAGWTPFGGGTRLCLGMNFSYLEQKVVLSMILMRYRISKSTFKLSANFLPTPVNFNLDFELLA